MCSWSALGYLFTNRKAGPNLLGAKEVEKQLNKMSKYLISCSVDIPSRPLFGMLCKETQQLLASWEEASCSLFE
jgi:hypothetical protein